MKALLGICSLLVVIGVLYGLAFLGLFPTQKWADHSPALSKTLVALHLAKRKAHLAVKRLTAVTSTPSPESNTVAAQEQQLAAARAQLQQDQQAFEGKKQQASLGSQQAASPSPDTGAKLMAIYATMDPEDIARIFAKLSDAVVVSDLMQLDEKKAGKILAVLPDSRAAQISRLMSLPAAGATQVSLSHSQTAL